MFFCNVFSINEKLFTRNNNCECPFNYTNNYPIANYAFQKLQLQLIAKQPTYFNNKTRRLELH